MTSRNNHLIAEANTRLGKDPAVSEIRVTLDPSKWSGRKKNIIINALEQGVATCGYQTGELVQQMLRSMGTDIARAHTWNNYIDVNVVQPEKLNDLIAYTCAWIKLMLANTPEHDRRYAYTFWQEKHFLSVAEEAPHEIRNIPLLRGMSAQEKQDFMLNYMIPRSAMDRDIAVRLADMVRNNEPITVTIN